MEFAEINASNYKHSSIFVQNEFVDILNKIIIAYDYTIEAKTSLPNNENSIRDHLLDNYLKKQWFKKKHSLIDAYRFDKEAAENTGRVDIRVLSANSAFKDDEAYYNIECKRLDNKNLTGVRGLNYAYVNDGMQRFIKEKYSTYNNTCAMIGFVVEKMNIDKNVRVINSLLQKESTKTAVIVKQKIKENFDYSYISKHKTDDIEIEMYHLMFNFSGLIN